jgi:hypothetical protein
MSKTPLAKFDLLDRVHSVAVGECAAFDGIVVGVIINFKHQDRQAMPRPIAAEQVLELKRCYLLGETLLEAGSAIGASPSTAEKYFAEFARAGLVRGERRRSTEHVDHVVALEVPLDVLADRDRRAMLVPASVIAWLAGDPLPGCSALDRRQPRLVPRPVSLR